MRAMLTAIALGAGVAIAGSGAVVHAANSGRPVPNPVVNYSTDGRYHTCGVITEDGVTSHLAEYARRCGR